MKKLTISSHFVNILILFFISFLAISINMAINPSRAEAAGHRVWACGFYPNSIDEFVGTVYDRLYNGDNNVGSDCGTGYSTDEQYMSGAAFIMLNMLNGKSDHITMANVPEARARFAEWETKVRYVASIGGVNLNWVNYGYGENSLWDDATFEDRYYGENGSADSIVFDLPGIIHIAIKKYCANLVAVAGRLPEPGNFDLTPTVNNMPTTAVRGQTIDVTSYVTNNGNGPSILSDRLGVLVARFVGYAGSEVLNPNPMWSNQVIPQGATWSFGGPITIPSNAALGSTFCVVLHVNPGAGQTYGPRTDNLRWDAACTRIVDKPFVHINNGDVWSGILFGDSDANNCNGNADGEIKSWVYNVSGSRGARGEHALTALGDITDFGSRGDPFSNFLKFANTPSNGRFLGNPTPANQECIPDYYEKFASAATGTIEINQPNDPDLENSGNGIFFVTHPGDNGIKLDGSGPAYNKKQVLLVEGNVFINGNIQFATNIASTENLPYLFIVARGGNITIADNVTQIDAVLISIPRDTNSDGIPEGGLIDTCVNGAGAKYTQLSTGICNQHLDINGSLIAKEVLFKRTYVNNPGDYQPAETINFPPGLFLSNPFDDYLSPEKQLGEVRQILDLPPVY